jgi:FtsH-binding integral membrane protein
MSNDPRPGILPVQSYELNHHPAHHARHDAPTVVAAPSYAYYQQQQYYAQQQQAQQQYCQPYALPAYLEPAASPVPVPVPAVVARGSEPVITPAAAEKKVAKEAARAAAREAVAAKKLAEKAAAGAKREAAARAVVEKQDAKRDAEAKKLAARQSVVALKLADQHAAETNALVSRHASAARRLREMQHAEAKRLAEKQAAATRTLEAQQDKEARRYAKPAAKAAKAATAAKAVAPGGSGVSLETRPGKPAKADLRLARARTVKPELARGVEANAESRNRRLRFIRLTYVHLLFALGAFGALLYALTTVPVLVENVSTPLVTFALGGRWNWAAVLGAFMVVAFIADYAASHTSSRAGHYLGLSLYIVAEALIFVPLLAIVEWKTHAILARGGAEPHIVRDAAYATAGIFTALTLSVLFMRRDFSFLKSALVMGTGAAAVLIGMSIGFGFQLGLAFSVGMILLAGAYILYQTSEVLAHYDTRHHVAASLALFASVALMFWYVIRVITRSRE